MKETKLRTGDKIVIDGAELEVACVREKDVHCTDNDDNSVFVPRDKAEAAGPSEAPMWSKWGRF